jgi:arginyl-tRNA synthetase
MLLTAEKHTLELGKIEGFNEIEAQELFRTIGLGALKYFILRVDPKKRMLFNPQESIDFHGQTGPFIQYTHARIQSILRKEKSTGKLPVGKMLNDLEKEMIALLYLFPSVADEAARNYDPSAISNYTYNLAKTYNSFYHECPILKSDVPEDAKQVRLAKNRSTPIRHQSP